MIRLVSLLVALAVSVPAQGVVRQPRAPSATVVMIPGSGFNGARAEYARRMSFGAEVWRGAGFRTTVAPYRRGKPGMQDVLDAVRAAHDRHPRRPLCVYGESSGGTWALQAAFRTGVVDCAVVLAGVTDQETLARSRYRLARHLGATMWPGYFGTSDEDDEFEPYDVWVEWQPPVPLLLVYATSDEVVPVQQGELLASVAPEARLRVLRRGPHRFVHGRAHSGDFVLARRAALALVAAQTTSP